MAYRIPFHRVAYRPESLPGNVDSDAPVEFDLSPVGGGELAKAKTLVTALGTLGLVDAGWTAQHERTVVEGLKSAPDLFKAGIDAIRGLSVPAAMAVKVGLLPKVPDGLTPDSDVPVTTGEQFVRLVPYQTALALELVMRLVKLSTDADIDPRFFGSPTTSPATRANGSGSAPPAPRPRGRRATAAGATAVN